MRRDRNLIRRYVKGAVSHSRIVTVLGPSEIRRILLDEKLSELRQSGVPRGNLVVIFESPDGYRVLKKSKTGDLRAEIETLQRLQGFNDSFPVVTHYSSQFDWFVTDYFPHVPWPTPQELEKGFLRLLELVHEKLGTSSECAAELIREFGLKSSDLATWLKSEGLCEEEIKEIISGQITLGLVYGSRLEGNLLNGTSKTSLQLIDFEKAHWGPIIIDFARLWERHSREIERLFTKFGGKENLNAAQQILFWRGLQAMGIPANAFREN